MKRLEVSEEAINLARRLFERSLRRALAKHGRLGFISTHEAAGTLREEVLELEEGLHDNSPYAVCKEAADVATVALWTVASWNQWLMADKGSAEKVEEFWDPLPKTPGQLALEHLRAMASPGNGYPKGIREDAAAALERCYKEAGELEQ